MKDYPFQVIRDINYIQIIKVSFILSILFTSVLCYIVITYFPNPEIEILKLKNRRHMLKIEYIEDRFTSLDKKMAILKTENEKLEF